jgi:hypothetical protein
MAGDKMVVDVGDGGDIRKMEEGTYIAIDFCR